MRDIEDLCPSRRAVLRSLAGAVLLPGVLVACSSDPAEVATGDSDSWRGGSVAASQVPVGQARVVGVSGRPVVVAQPEEGQFVAFSAVCTHQGTTVDAGDGLTLTCPNHGSVFDAVDGSVTSGPAPSPLPVVDVALQGEELLIG